MNRNFNQENAYEYSADIKKQLIEHIYSIVDISKFKYKLLENSNDLANFKDTNTNTNTNTNINININNINNNINKFFVSANFSGYNYLLVFCKLRNRNYSFFVDRKTLSFNASQVRYESVSIIPINIRLDNSIYNNTIIDGVYIKHDKKREKFFVITDLYYFRGVSTENDKINQKLLNIETYLDYNLKTNSNIILTVNKLYEINNLDKLIYEDIKKTRDFHIRGLSFYPEISGTKLIYVFNDDLDNKILKSSNNNKKLETQDDSDTSIDIICKTKEILKEPAKKIKIKYILKNNNNNNNNNNNIYFILELRKTNISDVYKLFAVEEEEKKILRNKKMGIAYIPTKECSRMCKEIINKNTSGRGLFKCEFDIIKKKWIPIEEARNVRIPDKINDIEKILEPTYESDTDTDKDIDIDAE